MSETPHPTPNLLIDEPRPDDRQALLDTFADQPEDPAVWDTAYTWVRSEGDHAGQTTGIASDIPAEELIAMADAVRGTDQSERYDLMTRTASNGQLWFDVIEGFSMDSIRQILTDAIDISARGQEPFSRALDLGTGTGKSLAVLEHNAQQVVGVDRNKALLGIAQQRAGKNTSLVQADITKLPFEDNSFDLISTLGVEGSLDKVTRTAFYKQLARVLMPGGTYISAFYNYPQLPSEEMAQVTQTSKGMLADMVCDTVSGGANVTERLDEDETNALLVELGLHKQYYRDTSNDGRNHAILQVISKDPGPSA